jgi:hypothetical protein
MSKRGNPIANETLKFNNLQKAAEDFRYLLNRRYPRKGALELVGNRYQLDFDQRHLLHRGIFSEADAKARLKKKIRINQVRGKDLAVDGYNVLITVEAGLSRRPLVHADDGFLRDISGLSGNFRRTETTEKALRLLVESLENVKPRRILILFDAPMSKSGILAEEVREKLQKASLLGQVEAVKVPERILIGFPGIVATSDTAIIDQSLKAVDLAGSIISRKISKPPILRLKRKKC